MYAEGQLKVSTESSNFMNSIRALFTQYSWTKNQKKHITKQKERQNKPNKNVIMRKSWICVRVYTYSY